MPSLDDIRDQVDARIAELEPLAKEYEQLLQIRDQIAQAAATRRPAPARPARATSKKAPRPARDKASSTPRGDRALALVQSKPGLTAAELAEEMGIKRNYLYRVLPRLQSTGKVEKRGERYYPAVS